VTAARPVPADIVDAPSVDLLYRVATAGAAGDTLEAAVEAILNLIGPALGAERVAMVAAAEEGIPARVLEPAWTNGDGIVPAPRPEALPDDGPGLCAALGIPGGLAVPLVLHDRRIGCLVLAGTDRRRAAERLAVPVAVALGPLLRTELAGARAERMDRLSALTRDLMSVVSHELRTPLTSIIGSLQTLQRPGVDPTSPQARRLLQSALARAERLRSLVEDLLITARPERPVRSKLLPVDVGSLVHGAVASVAGAAAVTTVEVDPALAVVLVDGPQLERAIVNLVDNALRHGDGTIEITADRNGPQVEVTVADHGPGLPPTIGRTVLDRHHQRDDAELRPAGAGLGLTITRGLVEGIGGRLTHRATPGGGATFVIAFPFRDGR
jgi:signal transduction histidine kinase